MKISAKFIATKSDFSGTAQDRCRLDRKYRTTLCFVLGISIMPDIVLGAFLHGYRIEDMRLTDSVVFGAANFK